MEIGSVNLFHRRTRTAYVYSGCLVWYNVLLTPRIRSSVKYSQLAQSANICDVSNQPTRTLCTRDRNDKRPEINIDCIARLSDTWN